MQAGKIKVTLIGLEGKSNADKPLQVDKYLQNDQQTLFEVPCDDFCFYTVGKITPRQYFGKLCKGTWYAYEQLSPEGQKSVIVQRMY